MDTKGPEDRCPATGEPPTPSSRGVVCLVPSGQSQRTKVDVWFVGLAPVQGTTAVSAKPPRGRISVAASTCRGSQLECRRPSYGVDKPPRRGDYEVCHLPLLSGEVPSPPLLRDLHNARKPSYSRSGRHHIPQMTNICYYLVVTRVLLVSTTSENSSTKHFGE